MHKKLFVGFLLVLLMLMVAACAPAPEATEAPEAEEPVEEPAEEVAEEPVEEPAEEPAPEWESPVDGALVAVPVEAAPELDGAVDDLWADAPAVLVEVGGGANMGETEVSIQSVYTDDTVYFLVTWADPTESLLRSPWVKQEDGTWAPLVDPNDTYHDNNLYYEDKLSFIWNVNNSIPDFETVGCFSTCHAGENPEFKPYGNKYTDEEGQYGDIWHWKSVRNIGQVDDQYLDWIRFSDETPGAGRHGDPRDSGGYVNNRTEDSTLPMWMGPEGFPIDGIGAIQDSEKLDFDDSLFVAGDMIPGIVKSPFVGDRGDISAGWVWEDGAWTLEIGRALVTGSEFDVQFDDLSLPYYFGVAIFDNAQVRHAYQTGPSALVFMP